MPLAVRAQNGLFASTSNACRFDKMRRSDVRAGPKALKPARPGPTKPEPDRALYRASEGSGPGLTSGPAQPSPRSPGFLQVG